MPSPSRDRAPPARGLPLPAVVPRQAPELPAEFIQELGFAGGCLQRQLPAVMRRLRAQVGSEMLEQPVADARFARGTAKVNQLVALPEGVKPGGFGGAFGDEARVLVPGLRDGHAARRYSRFADRAKRARNRGDYRTADFVADCFARRSGCCRAATRRRPRAAAAAARARASAAAPRSPSCS